MIHRTPSQSFSEFAHLMNSLAYKLISLLILLFLLDFLLFFRCLLSLLITALSLHLNISSLACAACKCWWRERNHVISSFNISLQEDRGDGIQ